MTAPTIARFAQRRDMVDVNAQFEHGPIYGLAGGLTGASGRSAGSSKPNLGKFVLSSQRARATSSAPVKPTCDLRTSDHSFGESAVTSVTVLPSFGPTAVIQGRAAVLVVNCGLFPMTANSCDIMCQFDSRACVISQS